MTETLEVAFDASGAAEAGRRGRVVAVVDVIDASTSAEAAFGAGAAEVLGAAPANAAPPVPVDPEGIAARAVDAARRLGTRVIVVGEPRVGPEEARLDRTSSITKVLREAGIDHEVVPNQGAEVPGLAAFEGAVVVVVSAAGGTAFDAALAAGAPAACFVTTARIVGRTGWEVAHAGALRAIGLARAHSTGLSLVAASSTATEDVLAASFLAQSILREGYTRP